MSATTYPMPEFNSLGIAVPAPANGVAGDFSNGSVTSTGSTTPRTLAARAAQYANVLDFNARCDGVTDDTAAVNAALASGAAVIIFPPNATCYLPNGISVSAGKSLVGTSFQPNNPGSPVNFTPSSVILTGPNVNCVTFSMSGTATQGARLSNLMIATNNAASPTSGAGVHVNGGYNVLLDHVMVYNCFDGYYWQGVAAAGISGMMDHCYSGMIAGHHVVQDRWPELRLTLCRFGMNAAGDLPSLAYVYITDTTAAGGILPNGFFCDNCQFNNGGSGATVGAWLQIGGLAAGGSGTTPQEIHISVCHVENVSTFVQTDSTVVTIGYLTLINNHLVYQTGNFFALSSSTVISDWVIVGNYINTATFTIPSILINDTTISDNSLGTPVNIAGTSNSSLVFNGNAILGSVTFAGGSWAQLSIVGNTQRGSGGFTCTATGNVVIVNPAGLAGTTTNNNAAAGYLGEYMSSVIIQAGAVKPATATVVNITSLTLTPGDWDIWGELWVGTPVGLTAVYAGLTTVSATIPSDAADGTARSAVTVSGFGSGLIDVFPLRSVRASLAASTVYYLAGRGDYTSGSLSLFGGLFARRRR